MAPRNLRIPEALVCLALFCAGCGPTNGEGEETLGSVSEALNVCDETVPDNRYVDGLPAYAQCDATTGSIWSNNGVDTATSSLGSDWVRTQQGGGYQCTEWAWRYMHFRFGIDYRHGDAREWCDGTLPATLTKSATPVHGDLIVFDGGVCGADATTGHIAVVDEVDGAKAKVTLVEENRAGRRTSDQSCALCFLHAVDNDGTSTGGAGSGAGGSGNGAAGGNPGAGAPAGGGSSGTGGSFGAGGRVAIAGATSGGDAALPGSGGGSGAGSGGARPGGSGGSASSSGGTSGDGGTSSASGGRGGSTLAGSGHGGDTSVTAGSGAGPGSAEPDAPPADETSEQGPGCSVGVASAPARAGSWWLVALGLVGLRGRRRTGSLRA